MVTASAPQVDPRSPPRCPTLPPAMWSTPSPAMSPTPSPAMSPTPSPGCYPRRHRRCRPRCRPGAPPRRVTPGFTAGRDDRRTWDAWLASLRGQYREGAVFALAQIGLPRPGACTGANGASRGEYLWARDGATALGAGCHPAAVGIPDYAGGWNSASQSVPGSATGSGVPGRIFLRPAGRAIDIEGCTPRRASRSGARCSVSGRNQPVLTPRVRSSWRGDRACMAGPWC